MIEDSGFITLPDVDADETGVSSLNANEGGNLRPTVSSNPPIARSKSDFAATSQSQNDGSGSGNKGRFDWWTAERYENNEY